MAEETAVTTEWNIDDAVQHRNPDIDPVYYEFRDWLMNYGFGYGPTSLGPDAELVMLMRFYTPEDCRNVMLMGRQDFFTDLAFAAKKGCTVEEAHETLMDLARRANLYHEKRDGVDYYRTIPAAHGIYEFHGGEFEPGWVQGLYATLGGGMLAQVYDAGVPFYRSVPCDTKVVHGEVPLEDDIFENLKNHRRFAVCNCQCLESSREYMGIKNCEHSLPICIQTDNMADFYLDDINAGLPADKPYAREISYEECVELLKGSVKNGFVLQTTFANKTNEVICSCATCHCGILQAFKMFPNGSAASNISHYNLIHDRETCIKCGACAKRCPMQAITMDPETGYPVIDNTCVACGQCALVCPKDARWLERKPEDQIVPMAESTWESYNLMEAYRRREQLLQDPTK